MDFETDEMLALEEQRQSPSAQAKLAHLLNQLALAPGERVLDLGCGGGSLARLAAPLVAPDGMIIGVDPSPAAVALACRLTPDPSGHVRFEAGDGHALRFADGHFDAAACVSVLAFCDDPARVLGEVRRVLRPGGRLLAVNSDEDTRVYNSRDRALGRRVLRAIADRARDPWIGRRLHGELRHAGFTIVREAATVTIEHAFDARSAGAIYARSWRAVAVGGDGVTAEEYDRWLDDLATCARAGQYIYSVTTFAYLVMRDA
ncbi:MAG: methyltransferase domain-containing protein [Chloroflexi bacterium]|nr:methyltransferase domain-containing protein [Chloroflexota bacterium]